MKCYFLKFGDPAYMKSLHEDGLIYMKNIVDHAHAYGEARHDNDEGRVFNPECKLSMVLSDLDDMHRNGPIAASDLRINRYGYCLYTLHCGPDRFSTFIDEKCRGFGDTAVLIHKPDIFVERICESLHALKYDVEYGFVQYLNRTNSSIYDPFQKDISYEHENEFRILTGTGSKKPLIFRIEMKDISTIIDFSSFNNGHLFLKRNGILTNED